MNELRQMICKCCGAPLDNKTLICSYCGTPHRIDNSDPGRVLKIETYQMPIDTFRVGISIDEDIARADPVKASELAVRQIAGKLAQSLVHMMRFTNERDLFSNSQIVRGEIKVVRPAQNDGIKFDVDEEE